MKSWLLLGVLGLLVVSVAGCGGGLTMAPVVPPPGLLISSVSAPLDVDLDKTSLGTKVGKASTGCILGLVAFGDASTAAAARNGALTVINHADYKATNMLFIYSSYTTIVYGD